MPLNENAISPPENVRIGHINIKVADLERSLTFYRDILGFKVTKRIGEAAAFLAYGNYHHDICLNTWQSKNGTPPVAGNTGLFHLAILFTEKEELRSVYDRIKKATIVIDSVVDHGVNESIYLKDPDHNGVELYWDKPREHWWSQEGELLMCHKPVDPESLFER
jgi:catechol 2,3-dioxygenase